LASTQLGATVDTKDHTGRAASPVHGSTMWWTRRPLRDHVRVVVPDVANPPVSGHRHITAQVHQDTTVEEAGDAMRGPVGREGLGGGTEVDMDAGGDAHRAGLGVEPDLPPTGSRLRWVVGCEDASRELVEVTVVSELDDGRPDRRVDDARRLYGHDACHFEDVEEQSTDLDRSSPTGDLGPPELRVGAETGAGIVKGTKVLGQQRHGSVNPLVDSDRDGHSGADRLHRPGAEGGFADDVAKVPLRQRVAHV
jgi:hypothetical protein